MAAVDTQLITTALKACAYGLRPNLKLVGGSSTTPAVVHYDMRAWDGSKLVYWTALGAPDIAPLTTYPVASGVLSNIQVIGVRS